MVELIYRKKKGQAQLRVKAAECSNCHGLNPKCKYLETGRKCRKGKANQKQTEKFEEYDSKIADMFSDYENEIDGQVIRYQKGMIERKEIKIYSFYRYLKKNDNAAAEYFRRHFQEESFYKSEIYNLLRKIKGKK